jgi:hypothetical protein
MLMVVKAIKTTKGTRIFLFKDISLPRACACLASSTWLSRSKVTSYEILHVLALTGKLGLRSAKQDRYGAGKSETENIEA